MRDLRSRRRFWAAEKVHRRKNVSYRRCEGCCDRQITLCADAGPAALPLPRRADQKACRRVPVATRPRSIPATIATAPRCTYTFPLPRHRLHDVAVEAKSSGFSDARSIQLLTKSSAFGYESRERTHDALSYPLFAHGAPLCPPYPQSKNRTPRTIPDGESKQTNPAKLTSRQLIIRLNILLRRQAVHRIHRIPVRHPLACMSAQTRCRTCGGQASTAAAVGSPSSCASTAGSAGAASAAGELVGLGSGAGDSSGSGCGRRGRRGGRRLVVGHGGEKGRRFS